MGDSISWREISEDNGRIETQELCFDGSGMDISHLDDLPKLFETRIEKEMKIDELLTLFATKYSFNGYLVVLRGNRI